MDNKLENTSGDTAMPGDLNDDGQINIGDITLLIDYLLGGGNDIYIDAADVDENGFIGISDVTTLIDLVLDI